MNRQRTFRRILVRTRGVLEDLDRLHRRGRFHGGVCPASVRTGRFGARLERPGPRAAAPEYRDPERMRECHRDPRFASRPEPRSDVYGVGALLYTWLEGGPPACGPASPLTRPAPPAVAWIVYRALAEGSCRYPTVRAMERDVRLLLALSRTRDLEGIRPRELPSHAGGRSPVPAVLTPFHRAARPRRPVRPVWSIAAVILLLAVLSGAVSPGDSSPPVREDESQEGLAGRLAGWRALLDERLRAAGEELSGERVPLLVVSDLSRLPDLGWPMHPSRELPGALRAILTEGITPGEVQRALLSLVGRETLPAVLWVTPGTEPGTVRARLYYRGLALEEVLGVISSAREVCLSPFRSKIDERPM